MKTGQILRAAADNAVQGTANARTHPEPELLLGYARGEMEGEAKARLQEHLSLCAACASAILDFRAFPYNPAAAGEDLTDREIDAEWLRLVGREKRPGVEGRNLLFAIRGRFGVFGYGLAAAFLVALVGLSTWTIGLRDRVAELSKPRVNVFVAQMSDDGGTRGSSSVVEVPSSARYVRFQLLIDDPVDYESYRVSIRDASGSEIIGNSEIVPSPGREFAIEVDVRQLPVGTGSIHVIGFTGSQESTLGEYAFTKRPQ